MGAKLSLVVLPRGMGGLIKHSLGKIIMRATIEWNTITALSTLAPYEVSLDA